MKDTEFECIEHGWRSHYQVCPFCMILVLQDDITKLKGKLQAAESLAASRLADHDSYRAAVEDALVVANIGVASGDAKADLHKLICWEIDVALDPRVSKRAADLISERETEVEKLTHERDLWENMAAMRLADQEAIERHTAKRVAGEIREIIGYCESFSELANEITNRYGVE